MTDDRELFVILTPGFASSENDSTCLPMQQQFVKSLGLIYPQLKPVVLSFQYPYHKKEYEWNGIRVIPFNGRNRGGLGRLLLRKQVNRVLRKLNDEHPVRGLLSFWLGECALVGKSFGKKNELRHYCWISGHDAKAQNKYAHRIAPVADELIALSDFLQDEFEKNHGIRPAHVIPPGIEGTDVIKNRDIDILGAGSLIALKQFEIFIKIVAEIRESFPKLKAVLAGDGPAKEALSQLASKHGLDRHLELIGSISHQEVLDLMSRSKLLLHPSSYEGFSGVCMEALSRGTHVISFCKAMKRPIEHWHIVNTQGEMKDLALKLVNSNVDHQPVIFRTMKEAVQDIMKLYPSASL